MQDQDQKSPYLVGVKVSRDDSVTDSENEAQFLAVVVTGNRFKNVFAFGPGPETACKSLATLIIEGLDKADDYDLTRKNGVTVTAMTDYAFPLDELTGTPDES